MTGGHRGVVYRGPNDVRVEDLPSPRLEVVQQGERRPCPHGVILRVLMAGICGSDLHVYRGRTSAQPGLVLGHEIVGEVVERGPDVQMVSVGDIVAVPCNIACGRCRNCDEGQTSICLEVNPLRPGGSYGYPDYGDWPGGQADYVLAPYADFNLMRIPDRDWAHEHLRDIVLVADVFPTGYHAAVMARVGPGSSVYIAGAGPIGLACATACLLLGASMVIVGDVLPSRLERAAAIGCVTVDVGRVPSLPEAVSDRVGRAGVDAAIDCVGYEARGGVGSAAVEVPGAALAQVLSVVRPGGAVSVPGYYTRSDPGAVTAAAQTGEIPIDMSLIWDKSLTLSAGGVPAKRYQRRLLETVRTGQVRLAAALGVTVVSLTDAPSAYQRLATAQESAKYLVDPRGVG